MSQKGPFPTGFFYDLNLLGLLLVVSRVSSRHHKKVFMLFVEALGVREYRCMVRNSRQKVLCIRAFSASNACFARDEPLSKSMRVGGVGLDRKPPALRTFVALHSALSRQSYCRRSRCWQNGIDTARCHHRMIRCWRAELVTRHDDLRREGAVMTAKPASALFCDTALWHVVWVCGRVGVFCGGMSDAMGSKTRFRLAFRLAGPWICQSNEWFSRKS